MSFSTWWFGMAFFRVDILCLRSWNIFEVDENWMYTSSSKCRAFKSSLHLRSGDLLFWFWLHRSGASPSGSDIVPSYVKIVATSRCFLIRPDRMAVWSCNSCSIKKYINIRFYFVLFNYLLHIFWLTLIFDINFFTSLSFTLLLDAVLSYLWVFFHIALLEFSHLLMIAVKMARLISFSFKW